MRWLALLPELLLLAAAVASFGALLAGGPRAGRVARAALLFGTAAAIASAVLTRSAADEFLFHAYRIDPLSQLVKLAVLTGSLLAAIATGRDDRWAPMRITSPFFHLIASLVLVMCASLMDVFALALALWTAVVCVIMVAASVGRWSVLEKVVRRSLAGWLGALAVSLAGAFIAAALAQTTRIDGFRVTRLAEQPGLMRAALMLWSVGAVWLVAVAPVQLRRIEEDPSGSRAAPLLGSTALASIGGLLLLRALALSAPGLAGWSLTMLLAIVVLPAPMLAAQRFAFSRMRARAPALALMFVLLLVLGAMASRWLGLAAAEL